MSEETELKLIGEETKAIFDKIQASPITSHDRVLALYRNMKSFEDRFNIINNTTLLIISQCLSELTRLELELRPTDRDANDE